MHPDRITPGFVRIRDRCGLRLGFHDLRHTHASQLFAQGVQAKIISERLGHATIGITMGTYTHLFQGAQDQAAALMDSILSKPE